MEKKLCSRLNCIAGHHCTTTHANCSNLYNYKVAAQVLPFKSIFLDDCVIYLLSTAIIVALQNVNIYFSDSIRGIECI